MIKRQTIYKDELVLLTPSDMPNTVAKNGGKIHLARFPWLTLCGRKVNEGNFKECYLPITCHACMSSGVLVCSFSVGEMWVSIQRYREIGYPNVNGYKMVVYPSGIDNRLDGYSVLADDNIAIDCAISTLTTNEWGEYYANRMEAQYKLDAIIRSGMDGRFFPLT